MMTYQNTKICFISLCVLLVPLTTHASFIESTIGTAVVNDATASYFNPAALVLMKNPQIIAQESTSTFRSTFTGQSSSSIAASTESGSTRSKTRTYSPSLYFGLPTTNKMILGLAIVSNAANRDADDNSILRYVQSKNDIQDYDIVPALAFKLNNFLSIGAGVNFSYANIDAQPIIRFPGSNNVDSQNHNKSDGTGIGGNAGFLFKPSSATVIGFNYRSMTTYNFSGKSIYEGPPRVVSNHYHFKSTTPARSVFSINHFFTKKFGLITTIQRIEWSTLNNLHVYGIANALGTTPIIINGNIPNYLRDTWLFTFGTHYRVTPKWILRVAGNYNQSPGNPHHQISNGDSVVIGASTGYEINKTLTVDGSYAHAFLKNERIDIGGARYLINGVNKGSRDAISLKLTVNL